MKKQKVTREEILDWFRQHPSRDKYDAVRYVICKKGSVDLDDLDVISYAHMDYLTYKGKELLG